MSDESQPVMVDTSVWIDAFRGRTKKIVELVKNMLNSDHVVTCGPVFFEIIQGLRIHEQKKVLPLFKGIPLLPFEQTDWEGAGHLAASLKQKGHTLPPIDVFIGQICLRYKVMILTLDQHFKLIPNLKLFRLEN